MKKVQIPKGHGKFRTIYIPSPKEAAELRELLPQLTQMERDRARHFGVSHVAHGFIRGRNPVTCATKHIGYDITFSFDLASWFDSVTQEQLINAGVDPAMAHAITVDGACRQGLPTSPTATNLVAVTFDRMLLSLLVKRLQTLASGTPTTPPPAAFALTRYADDISVSVNIGIFDLTMILYIVESSVYDCAASFGWKVAAHKTHVQTAAAGRRIVVGISVGPEDIQPTRTTKRRLRAARHKRNTRHFNGLREWAACKLPRSARGHRRVAGVTPGAPAMTTISATPVPANVVSTGTRRVTFD